MFIIVESGFYLGYMEWQVVGNNGVSWHCHWDHHQGGLLELLTGAKDSRGTLCAWGFHKIMIDRKAYIEFYD